MAAVCAATDGSERHVTWAELDQRSTAAGHLLAARGVGQDDRVVVALPGGADHLIATYAAWKLGATVVPLRADLPPWERDRMLGVAAATAIVAEWDGAVTPGELAAAPDGPPLPDRVPSCNRAVASGGTTGLPKLIVRLERGEAIPGGAFAVGDGYPGNHPGQVQLVASPLYHTNGFAITHSGLFTDQRIVLMERFDSARAVDLIERHRVTVMTMAPTMLLRILRLPDIHERDLSSLRGVMQGAATCPHWVLRAWMDLIGPEKLYIAYGSTEGVGLCLISGTEWLTHPGSVGPGLNTEIRILSPDDGRELPPGEVGEVYLRQTVPGPGYRYEGADPLPRTPDGFSSLGDLGWLDADGYLYIADRRVDMIVTGGANVFPAEVEAALLEHPAVADAGVIGLPDDEWGRKVHAVVEAVPGTTVDVADVDRHCRARLAAYKVPKSYEVVDALPRTEAGKLNRTALIAERAGAGTGTAPAN